VKVVIVEVESSDPSWAIALREQLASSEQVSQLTSVRVRYEPPKSSVMHSPKRASLLARAYGVVDQFVRDRRHARAEDASRGRPEHRTPLSMAEATAELAGMHPDVAIYVGEDEPPAWLVNSTMYGVLTIWSRHGPVAGSWLPWLAELADASATVSVKVMLHSHQAASAPVAVHSCVAAMRSLSPAGNSGALVLRSADLIRQVIDRANRNARGFALESLQTGNDPRGAAPSAAEPPALRRPGTAALVLRRLSAGRSARQPRWNLAYRRLTPGPGESALSAALDVVAAFESYDVLTPPRGVTWADPFPLQHDGTTLVFYEEQLEGRPGTIQVAELLSDGRMVGHREVLSLRSHLSYPQVFRWHGEFWMIPESAEAGDVTLYRAVDFPYRWAPEVTLMRGQQLVDPTPFEHAGEWWMFATRVGPDLHPHEDLMLFRAATPTGPWCADPRNPLLSSALRGRPAGSVRSLANGLLRPAQDCSVRYGYGLSLQHLTALSDSVFIERSLAHITPGVQDSSLLGIHTFNCTESVLFVDMFR
jgi:hypothetical protein